MAAIDSSDLIGSAPGRRKLIAVVYADMVGYSRLIGLDDIETLERLRTLRTTLIDPAINQHGGKIVQTGGDSLLITFDSIDGAVRCSVKIQQQIPEHDGHQRADQAIRFRIGINIGDVIADGTDLHGDGVNVAVRLQAECPPGEICVSRAVRDHVHGRLGLVFDELGALSLKNISRPVEAFVLRIASEATRPKRLTSAPVPQPSIKRVEPPRLSVMVAPLRNLDFAEAHERLAEEITEDFTSDLSKLPGSYVVGRSELNRVGKTANPRDLACELGISYVIQGSIRASVDRLGVNVQLIDSAAGAHIWAERFYVDRGDIADTQNEIVGRLVRVFSVKLTEDVNRRIEEVPAQDWTPYDHFMRGRTFLSRPLSQANRQKAIKCFEQALDGDPNAVDAATGIAFVLIGNIADSWSQSPDQDLVRAEQLLLDVLNIDSNIFLAHSTMGVLRRLQGRLEESRIEFEAALEIVPNNPGTVAQLGVTQMLLGQPETAIPQIQRSLRLAPHDPMAPLSYFFLGMCHLLLDDIEQAIDFLRKSRSGNPRIWGNHLVLAAALGLKGEVREAATALRQGIEIRPQISSISDLRALPWHNNPRFIALCERTLCAGLRLAGLPE